MRLTTLVTVFLLSAAGAASAQDPRPDVSGGYRYLHIGGSDDEDGTSVPKGWYLDVAYPITPMLSIVGDVGTVGRSQAERISPRIARLERVRSRSTLSSRRRRRAARTSSSSACWKP